jgi:hypothetical protein
MRRGQGYRVGAAADIGKRGGDAGSVVGLAGHRVVPGDKGSKVLKQRLLGGMRI